MATQTRTDTDLEVFAAFLRTHALVVRQLSQELVAEHGLTINDYEVLLRLARAPERSLRRVDLAEQVYLSPSGITRLLEGLERSGYVAKRACAHDARVTYAQLTDAGYGKLRQCSKTHVAGIRRLFLDHFSPEEQETLRDLLGRAGGEDDGACKPDE